MQQCKYISSGVAARAPCSCKYSRAATHHVRYKASSAHKTPTLSCGQPAATGTTILHHDMIPKGELATVKPNTGLTNLKIQSSIVGKDPIITDRNMKNINSYRSSSSPQGSTIMPKRSRIDAAQFNTNMKFYTGQNRSIENATGVQLP